MRVAVRVGSHDIPHLAVGECVGSCIFSFEVLSER